MTKLFNFFIFFIKKVLPMFLGITVVGGSIYLAYILIENIL
jgi:hypothetical protein